MNILLDISYLLQGVRFVRCQAGIHRVVRELLKGLSESPECTLRIKADNKSVGAAARARYLINEGLADCSPFARITAKGASLIERLAPKTTSGQIKLNQIERFIGECYRQKIDVQLRSNVASYSSADIYHSPMYALPAQGRNRYNPQHVLTVYDLATYIYPEMTTKNFLATMERCFKSIDETTWCACISESTRNDLLTHVKRCNPDRAIIIPLAASENFKPCESRANIDRVISKYGLNRERPYILSVCTIQPRKNLTNVLRAFEKVVLSREASETDLALVGASGWLTDEIQLFLSSRPHLAKRVIFTGYVPETDLAALYSGAHCFAYVSWYEGFGLPLLEAMQCGTAVIGSNTSSMPEVVGGAGVLVPPADVEGIADAMLKLTNDSNARMRFGQLGRERSQRFSWQRFHSGTIDLYKTILQAR